MRKFRVEPQQTHLELNYAAETIMFKDICHIHNTQNLIFLNISVYLKVMNFMFQLSIYKFYLS